MLRRISYYLLSLVFVAGMVACGGKSHDHLDHDAEEAGMDAEDAGHGAKGAHADEIILPVEKARAAGVKVEEIKPGMFHGVIIVNV